jgi:hypothetical protein
MFHPSRPIGGHILWIFMAAIVCLPFQNKSLPILAMFSIENQMVPHSTIIIDLTLNEDLPTV